MTRFFAGLILAITLNGPAMAAWTLDNDASELSFVSTKAVDIAEVHRFTELAGRISDRGEAVVTVSLATVATGIEVRDERMRDILFETGRFPFASARTKIASDILEELKPGDSARMSVTLSVELHGETVPVEADVVVARLSENTLTVTSAKQLIVNAQSFKLAEGIQALREIANLPSIGNAVPVSFALTFTR